MNAPLGNGYDLYLTYDGPLEIRRARDCGDYWDYSHTELVKLVPVPADATTAADRFEFFMQCSMVSDGAIK